MARGEAPQTRIYFKGKDDEFVIFVNNAEAAERWNSDKSTPLVRVVKTFQIFKTREHGSQGGLLIASNADLRDEFESDDIDKIIEIILEKGILKNAKVCGLVFSMVSGVAQTF
ncbi:hypothetical protein PMZ80_011260 [Knufia obscura]|uniref:Ribosome maturation protein SDO1/SBDS N-terminal domain-containing protein n=2 Tax=Knufia obscura TaxID=1635080 RepID=A0ABR0R8B3_9EURO|nr:hypothetical protein PMZ80_011260 [Knufia obscura]